ncbi:MAG: ATP-binding cassette domain-containing protein [Ardenticatenia bacterium]|nr:ATP-binding cassette domain-containing protein [Ardenticatenia bacterium]
MDTVLAVCALHKQWHRSGQPSFTLTVSALDVRAGEIHVITGPKGAGKSTLGLLLAGLEPPDRGTVCVLGKPLTSPRATHHLSYLSAPYVVPEHNTVMGDLNVLIPLVASAFGQPTSELRSRLCAMLELLGLSAEALSTPAFAGTPRIRRAVDVALTLAPRVPLYILDEPCRAVSPETRQHMLALFRLLRSEGHSFVIMTALPEVASAGDRVSFLQGGCLTGDVHPDAAEIHGPMLSPRATHKPNDLTKMAEQNKM